MALVIATEGEANIYLIIIILVFSLTINESSVVSGIHPFSSQVRHSDTSAPARRGTSYSC